MNSLGGALALICCLSQATRVSAQQQATAKGQGAAIAVPAVASPLAFTGVTVVDVQTGKLLPEQTVLVEKNRISAVGERKKVRLPAGVRVVDAQGKYLIPGLWNMHSHVSDHVGLTTERYEDFIVNGITGTREMAQRIENGADSLRLWQSQTMAGTRVGPRVWGPSADLSEIEIKGPADVPHVMDSLKAAGMVFIKFHNDGESRETYFAIAREARRIGVPFVGHRAHGVTEVELSDSGQRSLEHMNELQLQCWYAPDTLLAQECATSAQHFIRNGTWFVPTIVRFDPFNNFDSHRRGCRPDSMHADHPLSADTPELLGAPPFDTFVQAVHAAGKMHRAGIQMLAGTDAGAGVPIFECALHVELALLVDAGLTPLEALQTATLNPAKFFNATDSMGTIATGKLADLVLLDANPLVDIHNTKKIRAVVANGRYFDRATLDTLAAQLLELERKRALEESKQPPQK